MSRRTPKQKKRWKARQLAAKVARMEAVLRGPRPKPPDWYQQAIQRLSAGIHASMENTMYETLTKGAVLPHYVPMVEGEVGEWSGMKFVTPVTKITKGERDA